jgi:glycosyltransferase involved in cell wall biosynthesis
MPKVSVIIPTYNRCALVQKTIDSVLDQTFQDFELIVIDDGSTDDTPTVIPTRYGDRVRYIWQKNGGESTARNHAMTIAQGEYIAYLDSDDLWMPEKLQKQVDYIDGHPEVGLVLCTPILIDDDDQIIPDSHYLKPLKEEDLNIQSKRWSGGGVGSTLMIRRELVDKIGGFAEDIQYGEDFEFFTQALMIAKPALIPETLAQLRIHSNRARKMITAEQADKYYHDTERIYQRFYEAAEGRPEIIEGIYYWKAKRDVQVAVNLLTVGQSDEAKKVLLNSVATTHVTMNFEYCFERINRCVHTIYSTTHQSALCAKVIQDVENAFSKTKYFPDKQLRIFNSHFIALLAIWLWKDWRGPQAIYFITKAFFQSPIETLRVLFP